MTVSGVVINGSVPKMQSRLKLDQRSSVLFVPIVSMRSFPLELDKPIEGDTETTDTRSSNKKWAVLEELSLSPWVEPTLLTERRAIARAIGKSTDEGHPHATAVSVK
jgi:hypothetical protein